jgi:hypothetical protein
MDNYILNINYEDRKFYVKCVYRIIFLKFKKEDTHELKKKIEYVNFVI